jgi:hypothetical protein
MCAFRKFWRLCRRLSTRNGQRWGRIRYNLSNAKTCFILWIITKIYVQDYAIAHMCFGVPRRNLPWIASHESCNWNSCEKPDLSTRSFLPADWFLYRSYSNSKSWRLWRASSANGIANGIAMHMVKPASAHPSKNADTKITGGTVLRESVQPPVTFDIKSGIAGFP